MSLVYRSSPSFYTVERNGLKVVSVQLPSSTAASQPVFKQVDHNKDGTRVQLKLESDFNHEETITLTYASDDAASPVYSHESTFYPESENWSKPGYTTAPTYSFEKTASSPAFTITVLPETHAVSYTPTPLASTFFGVESSPYHAVSYTPTPPAPTFSEYESLDPEGVTLSCFRDVMLESTSAPMPETSVAESQSWPSYLDEMINTPEPRPMSNARSASVATAELMLPLHLVEAMEAQQVEDDVVSTTAPTPKKLRTEEVSSDAPTPKKTVTVMAELHSDQMMKAQQTSDDDLFVVWSTVPTPNKPKTVVSSTAPTSEMPRTVVSSTSPTPKKRANVVSSTAPTPKKSRIEVSTTAPTPKKPKTEVKDDFDWEWELDTAVEIMRKLSEETGRELLERQQQQHRLALQHHLRQQEVLRQQYLMAQMRMHKRNSTMEQLTMYNGNPTLEQMKMYTVNPTLEQLKMHQGNPTLEQLMMYKRNPTLEQLKMHQGNPTMEQLTMYNGNPTLEQMKMYTVNPTLEQLRMYKKNLTLEQMKMYKTTIPNYCLDLK